MSDPTPQSSASTVAEEQAEPTVGAGEALAADDLVVDELLVEDVSIDGMCGVY
jgi:mycofactocin precursor